MRLHVLINSAAGTAASGAISAEAVEAEFARHNVPAKAELVPPEHLEEAVRRALASDVDVVVAGGGDGTINTVATLLLDSGKALGILPLGTMNHLAKELSLPAELPAAVAALAQGTIEPFAVGEVNGRVFLSFSGFGLYAEVIKHRDAQRRARGRGKWWAMAVALYRVLVRLPLFHARVRTRNRTFWRITPLLFVALSEYQRRVFGVDDLACPGRNALSVYLAKPLRRWGIIRTLARAVLRRPDPHRDLEAFCTPELEILTHRRHLRVALDGEVIDLRSPLRYRLRPGALRLLRPRVPAGGAAGANAGLETVSTDSTD